MIKYFFEFTNVKNTLYRGEISNNDYSGQPIEITGNATLEKDLSGNIFQPLQITTCKVGLDASNDNPLEDIYNEDDRYWLFTLLEEGQKIFQGYISTIEMEQSYASSQWELNFDAFGHLHYLKDVGYYDSLGLPYSGIDSLLNIAIKCFDKCFNENDPKFGIITAHHLEYNSTPLFDNVYLDQSQFYDDEGESKDCKTILEEIFKSLGCFVVQYRLNFVIMSVNNWTNLLTQNIPYRSYTSAGVFQATLNFGVDSINQRIGEEINNVPTHHIESNQSFYNTKFYNAFKVRHDFEYSEQILPNGELLEDTGTMPNWTLAGDAAVNGDALDIDGKQFVSEIALAATSSTIGLKQNDKIEVIIDVEYFTDPTEQAFKIILQGNSTYYYRSLQQVEGGEIFFNEWTTSDSDIEFKPTEGIFTHTIQLNSLPEDGDLRVEIYTGIFGNAHNASSKTQVKSVIVKALEQNLEAEEWIAERTDKTTGQVPEVYEVRYNTVNRQILKNIFLDSLGLPIGLFNDGALNTAMARHLVRDFMRFFSERGRVFSGSVFNNNGFTPKRIDFLGSYYITTSETKNLKTNVSAMELVQVSRTIPVYNEETNRVFKDPIKPTIKG